MAEPPVHDIVKRQGCTQAAHAGDLGLGQGEFFIQVGPSDWGRPTLLRRRANPDENNQGAACIPPIPNGTFP